MKKNYLINKQDVKDLSVSNIRCDGTCNIRFDMMDGQEIELFCVGHRMATQIEDWFLSKKNKIKTLSLVGFKTTLSEKNWFSQNGIPNNGIYEEK